MAAGRMLNRSRESKMEISAKLAMQRRVLRRFRNLLREAYTSAVSHHSTLKALQCFWPLSPYFRVGLRENLFIRDDDLSAHRVASIAQPRA